MFTVSIGYFAFYIVNVLFMRAYIPQRFRDEPPKETGEYLTDLGLLFYSLANKSFYSDSSRLMIIHYVRNWFKEVELFTASDMEDEYERGYSNGLRTSDSAHSIIR
jgi:hypothetical protein